MDLNPNDVAARTRNVRITIGFRQCYVAVDTLQAVGIIDFPAVVPAVNDL